MRYALYENIIRNFAGNKKQNIILLCLKAFCSGNNFLDLIHKYFIFALILFFSNSKKCLIFGLNR